MLIIYFYTKQKVKYLALTFLCFLLHFLAFSAPLSLERGWGGGFTSTFLPPSPSL